MRCKSNISHPPVVIKVLTSHNGYYGALWFTQKAFSVCRGSRDSRCWFSQINCLHSSRHIKQPWLGSGCVDMSVQVGLGVGSVNHSLHQSQRKKTLGQQTVASCVTLENKDLIIPGIATNKHFTLRQVIIDVSKKRSQWKGSLWFLTWFLLLADKDCGDT